MKHNPNLADERIFLNKQSLLEIEKQIRLERHIERYSLIRQFVSGVVCDAACGCGYGSYLLSTNPDVKQVIGLDISPEAIEFAMTEYSNDKTMFETADLKNWISKETINTLVSLETIEHIPDLDILPSFVERNGINNIILSYPSKKTTHYNKYHFHDFQLHHILDMFKSFICYKHINWKYEFDVVFLQRKM